MTITRGFLIKWFSLTILFGGIIHAKRGAAAAMFQILYVNTAEHYLHTHTGSRLQVLDHNCEIFFHEGILNDDYDCCWLNNSNDLGMFEA